MRTVDQSSLAERISVEIISSEDLDEETAAEAQMYSVQVVNASPTAISIKIKFEHPEAISTSKKDPTIVQVKARFSDFEPGWLDDLVLVNKELEKQKSKMALVASPEQIVATKETASSAKQATVMVIIFNILTSKTLNELWNMINGMQIYANLPMF